ncbi:hypothetical protein [Clostridium gasigenes]|uniref:Uncharacterized protein n=1 Tax=Clostridium gasigenes TaxID=94869 RepID=A0A1H0TAS1_9CLOT|nr:hypothetical protein [Clostridium gasigenes]SDP50606.1 hypothetical protein SAMN04488529_106142 [Clostridium gasigenes]
MKKSNEYINMIGVILIIILMGINENMIGKSSLERLIVAIILMVIGIGLVIINLISILKK